MMPMSQYFQPLCGEGLRPFPLIGSRDREGVDRLLLSEYVCVIRSLEGVDDRCRLLSVLSSLKEALRCEEAVG